MRKIGIQKWTYFNYADECTDDCKVALDPHFGQDCRYAFQQRLHIIWIESPDMANPETVGIADFARIDHQPELVKPLVKFFEVE